PMAGDGLTGTVIILAREVLGKVLLRGFLGYTLRDSKHSVVILRTAFLNCPADVFPKLRLGLWPICAPHCGAHDAHPRNDAGMRRATRCCAPTHLMCATDARTRNGAALRHCARGTEFFLLIAIFCTAHGRSGMAESVLQPHRQEIARLYFEERNTKAESIRYLQQAHGIRVDRSPLSRFLRSLPEAKEPPQPGDPGIPPE